MYKYMCILHRASTPPKAERTPRTYKWIVGVVRGLRDKQYLAGFIIFEAASCSALREVALAIVIVDECGARHRVVSGLEDPEAHFKSGDCSASKQQGLAPCVRVCGRVKYTLRKGGREFKGRTRLERES